MFMKHAISRLLVAAGILCAGPAMAQAPVSVTGVWARATAPGQTDGAVYMSLVSKGGDTLTGAESPDADMAMLHSTMRMGGMSGMKDVDALALPAGKVVMLAPHGYHLMLMGLKHGLKAGQKIELDLEFAKAGKVHVTAPVEPLGASGPPG